jgi:ribose transport system permease protein
VITQGFPLVNLPAAFSYAGQGTLAGVPLPFLIMILIGLLFAWIVRSTTFGWHVFALGGNAESALLAGIRVVRVRIALYTLCSLLAATGGLLLTARLGVGDPSTGTGYELNVIASCIIGGVSLYGGVGTIFGMLLGSALIGVIQNGLVLLGVNSNWQQFALGGVILVAVIVDRARTVRTERSLPSWLARLRSGTGPGTPLPTAVEAGQGERW